MRAAQIYLRDPSPAGAGRLIEVLLREPRVDQVLWRTALTRPGEEGYTVASSRGTLEFSRDAAAGTAGIDAFGNAWTWHGEAGVLDVQQERRTIDFGRYPNAFERIAGALDLEKSGELWVTARPGCEFEAPGGEAHIGGASHGALHALDSLCPVIVAGGAPRLPARMRSLDIAPLCMKILGIPMRYGVGDSRS